MDRKPYLCGSAQGEGLLPYARLLALCAMVYGLPPGRAWHRPVREILLLIQAFAQADKPPRPNRAHLEALMQQFPDLHTDDGRFAHREVSHEPE